MATNLFAQRPNAAGGSGSSPLVQFRAGKMNLDGNTVRPDIRKGLVQLFEESGAYVLKWIDRSTNRVEDSIFLFPGQATYQRVPQCTTGRVYLLNFIGGDRKCFFWMQEPKEDKDSEYAATISRVLGQGGASAAPTNRNTSAPTTAGGAAGQSQQQQADLLSQLLGGGNRTRQAQPTTAAPPANQDPAAQLQNLLRGAQPAAQPAAGLSQADQLRQLLGGAGGSQQQQVRRTDASLVQLLTSPEVLSAIQEDPAFYHNAVAETLPQGVSSSPANIVENVRNPQVSSTAGLLQEALRDPAGFRELCMAFNVRVPGNALPSVEDFLDALAKEHNQEPPTPPPS